ncbi:MAG: YkgJ family cysteine cluster protein [Saprospiraceae bacterium]|jgi:hypothetical protein|nr:YkgJ family cysteine cluster protein [Saprospiraceae bacterium]MBK7439569.1 YkgJ family cysteine cluster protein [Saprospiraceae bacterium]MBK8513396.1 YkgJ family cysteine cluster protein [Saprospiraceae bacterium]
MDPTLVKNKYDKNKTAYKKYLSVADIKKAIPHLQKISDLAYQKTDCLTCAACCKNYSPRFKAPDIKRISKYLGVSEKALMDRYLHRDEDGDYVLNTKPCTFLDEQNKCTIYEVRPSDCHRFPYVDEDVFLKRKELTLKNASFCPIAQDTLDQLMKL